MRCIDKESLPCALLYFTGSGEFNKNMRSYANKKGFTLNEYGIFKRTSGGEKGIQITVGTESDVFEILGKEYISPENRIASFRF